MPGLFGVMAREANSSQEQLGVLALRMADTLSSRPWLHSELQQIDQFFWGGRVHLNVLNPGEQPIEMDDEETRFWFDGELFPEHAEYAVDPEYAQLEQLLRPSDGSNLAKMDGLFTLAAYDRGKQELVLANDRLGFRPLYFLETDDWFAYAAEVKALIAICDTLPNLDKVSLSQFFGFGYMLGERTWWEPIKLLPPGSLWRITANERHEHRYWSFEDIKANPIPEDEARETFGILWSRAVRQRSKPGLMPLLLSGGLDSRLLLAELSAQGQKVTAITFGSVDSTDMLIAEQCARIAGVRHWALVLGAENWWHRREDAIWQVDGLVNCMDLHVAIATDYLRTGNCYSPMNMAGDLLFGGSYLKKKLMMQWQTDPAILLEAKYLPNPFFASEDVIARSKGDWQPYLGGPSPDCFYLFQRVRRMTTTGPGAYSAHCETVYPSVSLPLLHFVFGSLADEQRLHSRFYSEFLLAKYPEFYRDVPWQRAGRGLAETALTRISRGIRRRARSLFGQANRPYDRGFANYSSLLEKNHVRETLLRGELLGDEFLSGTVRQALENQRLAAENPRLLTAILTFEVYLRQATGIPTMKVLSVH